MWNQEYRDFLRQAAETDLKLNLDVAFMIEGAADIYAPYAVFQGYFCPRYAGTKFAFPELLKYTFPQIIQANFFNNPRNSPNTIYPGISTLPHDVAIYWLARDILIGKLFAFMDPVTEDQAWWGEVAKLLAIRKAAAPWIGQGTFRDTVDVSHADATLEVKTYRWRQGNHTSTLVAILNPDKRNGAKIAIRGGHDQTHIRAFRLRPDGSQERIPMIAINERVAFTTNADLLSMVVIQANYRGPK